ncbi:MAG: hypothetical protein ACLSDO_05015 [Anaerotruncus colihominis]
MIILKRTGGRPSRDLRRGPLLPPAPLFAAQPAVLGFSKKVEIRSLPACLSTSRGQPFRFGDGGERAVGRADRNAGYKLMAGRMIELGGMRPFCRSSA